MRSCALYHLYDPTPYNCVGKNTSISKYCGIEFPAYTISHLAALVLLLALSQWPLLDCTLHSCLPAVVSYQASLAPCLLPLPELPAALYEPVMSQERVYTLTVRGPTIHIVLNKDALNLVGVVRTCCVYQYPACNRRDAVVTSSPIETCDFINTRIIWFDI